MKCSPWKCLLSFAGALLPAMWQAKRQCSGPRTDLVLTHLLSLLGTGWLARKKTEAAKREPAFETRPLAISLPFLTAYCSCDCIEEKLVALDLGWLSEFGCACLVVEQLGSKAFCVPAYSALTTAATNSL